VRREHDDHVGLLRLPPVAPEQVAEHRHVAEAGDVLALGAFVLANQARQDVGFAVTQPDLGRDPPRAERRQTVEPRSPEAAQLDVELQRHVVVGVGARDQADVDTDRLVVELRLRLDGHTALRDGGDGERRDGDALAELGDRFGAVGHPDVRVGQDPRVRVRLEQPVVEHRDVRHQDVGLTEVAQGLERDAVLAAGDRRRSVDASRAGRGELQPVLLESRAVDLHHLDVDHDLRLRLVERRQEAPERSDPVGRVTRQNRVGPRNAEDEAVVADHAERIERLGQVDVLQRELTDDVAHVLTLLGRGVRRDDHHRRACHHVERVGRCGDGVECLSDTQVAQYRHGRRQVDHFGVERDRQIR